MVTIGNRYGSGRLGILVILGGATSCIPAEATSTASESAISDEQSDIEAATRAVPDSQEKGEVAQGRAAAQVLAAEATSHDEPGLARVVTLSGPWSHCGTITDINPGTCQLPSYASAIYEYGVVYNSPEPLPVVCTWWNYGARVYNKEPYFVWSDNPMSGMLHGGFVFYTATLATDDDTCPVGLWRHKYWYLNATQGVTTEASNGCYGASLPIYCRAR